MHMLLALTLTMPPMALPAQQAAAPTTAAPAVVEILLHDAVAQQFKTLRALLVRLAEKMPDDGYAFQPVPEIRTFAASLTHLIQSNVHQCNALRGTKHALTGTDWTKLTAKADVVQALQASLQHCGEYFEGVTKAADLDGRYFETATLRDGVKVPARASHAAVVTSWLAHNNEMYGYLAMYLRMKGIVPPSSEPRTPR